jgi:hypothetical protein
MFASAMKTQARFALAMAFVVLIGSGTAFAQQNSNYACYEM